MLKIGNTIISLDVIEKSFFCDISKCLGTCCIEGDSGAPLEDGEEEILEAIYPKIKNDLSSAGVREIERQGTSLIDSDGDLVTPLVNKQECVYAIFENNIARCGIEKAFFEERIDFRKPISCQLYPIRVEKYPNFEAVNYNQWHICKAARCLGLEKKVAVFQFLKEPLIRKYGKDWYCELERAAKLICENEKSDKTK